MFDGILFDLDGTLWDVPPVMERVWAQLLPRHPKAARPPVTLAKIKSNEDISTAPEAMGPT